ncbi:MAG: DUF4271 domain-containing protein [Mucilaginibacter sp.]
MLLKKLRFIGFCCLLMLCSYRGYAQGDSLNRYNLLPGMPQQNQLSVLDSVVLATKAHEQFLKDSVALLHIKYPDAAMNQRYLSKLADSILYKGYQFLDIPGKPKTTVRNGHSRQTRDQWVVFTIICLLLYTALLNITLNKDVKTVVQSFYSKRVLVQAGKEEGYINFWAFAGLFLLFGLTFGLIIYQLAVYNNTFYSIAGFRLFITLSLIILVLFAVKFLILKFLGFIFDINRVIGEYISILYLTYFNIAFVFLPLAVCFCLLDARFIPYLLVLGLILIVIIFTWLYLRSSVNIISNIRFHKFYLIVYLCALEICPVLILIKALDI